MSNEQAITAILDSLNRLKETMVTDKRDLKDLIKLNHDLTLVEIGAVNDMMIAEFRQVKDKQDKTNGTIYDHTEAIKNLELNDATHVINCPQGPKITKIVDDLEEYRVFKKWPKIGILLFLLAFLVIGITAYGTYKSMITSKDNNKMLQELEILKQDLEAKPTPAHPNY